MCSTFYMLISYIKIQMDKDLSNNNYGLEISVI